MNINDKTLHDFGADLQAALAPLQEKYGVTIRFGNINYTQERFTTKLTVTNGQSQDEAEQNAFDADVWRYAHLGLEWGMFNRIFLTPDGQRMALRGFNTRSPKYPIIALRLSDGQRLRCAEKHIAKLTDEYYQGATASPSNTSIQPDNNTTSPTEDATTPEATATPVVDSIQPDLDSLIDEVARSEQETPLEKQFWEKMTAGGSGEQALRELYRTAKKVGPNDPCPCGSGKKYKKFCGRG